MPDQVYRTYESPDSIVIRDEAEGDGRTIDGYAVLFDVPSEVEPGVFEIVRKGALKPYRGRVYLRDKHGPLGGVEIGMVETTEDDKGLKISARISDTTHGRDALQLIRDKVIQDLSIGYYEAPGYVSVDKENRRIVNRGDLFEVALSHQGAHQGAQITAIREVGQEPATKEGTNMPDTDIEELRAEVVSLREANEMNERRLATFTLPTQVAPNPFPVASQFRSAGEWLKAVADPATREDALKVNTEVKEYAARTRDFAGTTTADTNGSFGPTTWLADAIRIVADNSIAVDRFRRAPLPTTGLHADYLTFGDSTLQVQEQENEGDTLAFGKLNLDADSTDFKTYGGYTSFSFQAIRKSPVNIVDTAYSLLTREASKRRNAALVAKLLNGVAYSGVEVGNDAPGNYDEWISVLVAQKMAQASTGLGLPVDSYLVSSDVYTQLIGVKDDDGNRLMALPGVNYGANIGNAGTMAYPAGQSGGFPAGFGGSILGVPVFVEPALDGGTFLSIAKDAAVVFGDDSVTRLGPDQDITNLTSEISVYFEMGAATQFPDGIQKLEVPGPLEI